MTIIETIQTAVGEDISRSYDNYIQQAASALQQREEEIKRRITQYAARRGLRPGEINGILEEVGLNDHVLADTAATAHESSSALVLLAQRLSEQVADLNRRIQNL
jgi:hypothetical protein